MKVKQVEQNQGGKGMFVALNNNQEQRMPKEGEYLFCIIHTRKVGMKLYAGHAKKVDKGCYEFYVETVDGKKVFPYLSDIIYNHKVAPVHSEITRGGK